MEQQAQDLVKKDDPRTQANFVWALVHGIALLAIDGSLAQQGAEVEALAHYAMERLRSGIGA